MVRRLGKISMRSPWPWAVAASFWGCTSTATIEGGGSSSTSGTDGSGGSAGSGGAAATTAASTTTVGAGGATAGTAGRGGASGAGGRAGGGGAGAPDAGTRDAGGGAGSGGTVIRDASPPGCGKRGIASVLAIASAPADLAALSAPAPGVSWFYSWSTAPSSQVGTSYVAAGVEWVPMVWGHPAELTDAALASKIRVGPNTKYLLGYNEPNFHAQSNLTPAQAAAGWPFLERAADQLGLLTVAPVVNFCGPAGSCNQVDPFVWLDQFLAACSTCRIDFVAFHSYACDANWFLTTYMRQAVDKYYTNGKPPRKLWVTELACADSPPAGGWTVPQIQSYMNAIIPWFESQPAIFRYSWFGDRTGRPNDPAYVTASNALLAGAGQLTALGTTYTTLAGVGCP